MTLIKFSNVARGQEVRSQKSIDSDEGLEFGPWSEFNDYNDLLTWPPGQELRIHGDAVTFIEVIKLRCTCIWSEVCMLTAWLGARQEATV